MKLLFGVGNENNGDDGIGPYVARRANFEGWRGVNCSVTPENFTSLAKKEKPELLVLVDATEMGLEPGDMRIVPASRIDELTLSTHYIPLSILIRYLSESAKKVVFVGIQPKCLEGELSKEAREGAERLLEYLRQERLDKIRSL